MKTSTALLGLLLSGSVGFTAGAPVPPQDPVFSGDAAAAIASGVGLPAGRAYFWTSGTVAAPVKKDGTSVYERYGDTYVQSLSSLKKISEILATQGLTLKEVVYLRVYVAADAMKSGRPDFAAWFRAYGEFFNTKENPAKTARTTVGVAALVNPDQLIEIEAVAVYPEKK